MIELSKRQQLILMSVLLAVNAVIMILQTP
jgi:hypothetical protein